MHNCFYHILNALYVQAYQKEHICSGKCITSQLAERSLVTVVLTFSLEAGDILLWEASLTDVAEPGTGYSPKMGFPNPAPQTFCSSLFSTHVIQSVLIPSYLPVRRSFFPDDQNQAF